MEEVWAGYVTCKTGGNCLNQIDTFNGWMVLLLAIAAPGTVLHITGN